MKKIAAIAAALVMIPFSSFGFQVLSDADLNGIFAQSGINIAIDDVRMHNTIDYIAYVDTDGSPGGGGAGSIELSKLDMIVDVNTIGPGGRSVGTNWLVRDYSAVLATMPDFHFESSPLSIDVGACQMICNAAGSPVKGVLIGLPTVEIAVSAMSFTVGVGDGDLTSTADTKYFGRIDIGKMAVAVLSGKVEIAPR